MEIKESVRTRELLALFRMAETLEREDLPLLQIYACLLADLPMGFAHSDLCRVRISLRGEGVESPGFEPTPWGLRASFLVHRGEVGLIEVHYLENPTGRAGSLFSQDEKKLVDITARKLGEYTEAWERTHSAGSPFVPRKILLPPERKPEWRAVLDLLDTIDSNLHGRLLRRLINYLIKSGVPGIREMIVQFDPAIYALREVESHGSNTPIPRRALADMEATFNDILKVASITLDESTLNDLIRLWMRQDKLSFMALATEKRDISLGEITEIIQRFCRSTEEGVPSLSTADDQNVRVALSRRFLTENLKYIRVAKENMSIYDFGELLTYVAGPSQGNGKLGGKAAGLILASHILKKHSRDCPLLANVRVPRAWYITSDAMNGFLRLNALEDLWSTKFSSIEEIRNNYPYLEQVMKNSFFPQEMSQKLQFILDDLGENPLIVRSSSLLEDSEGSAFSGKYRSLFLPNVGSREQRLQELRDAVAEVYASVYGPDPMQYRSERGLLDFMEEMGIIIMQVVGKRVGKYFFPAFAGVAFSNNEFRWTPRIRREDGLIRLVTGLGTRAVDRIGDDFPMLVCPGQPELRVNSMPDQVIRYAQSRMDVINLETASFESPNVYELIREVGDDYPLLEELVSVNRHGILRKPTRGMLDTENDDLVVTFAGLMDKKELVQQVKEMLRILQESMGTPIDMEFAHDGTSLYLLQCRPQSRMDEDGPVVVPQRIPSGRKLFSASKYVTNGWVTGVRYVVYVDPEGYGSLPTHDDMVDVATAVSQLNSLLPRRQFILMGPGRWGSRGDIKLGVGITYSDINNSQMLIEIARRKGNYVPDLSFGTHFFQDLVEAKIRYLALYPDEDDNLFNEAFFLESPNCLSTLLPRFAFLEKAIRVIDVEQVQPGCELQVVMDGEKDIAFCYLTDRK